MIFLQKTALFFHLAAFAFYVGAGFFQQRLMRRSTDESLPETVRYDHEQLVANILTFVELPAIMLSVASGVAFVAMSPALMQQGWLHGKLTCVAILLVLSHIEMFNARKIVKLRASGTANMGSDISARKIKHQTFGLVGTLVLVALLALVSFAR